MSTPTSEILFKRGLSSAFSTVELAVGEPAFLTDTGKLYVGNGSLGTANVLINPDYGTAADKDTGTSAGNVVVVGPGGKIDPSIVPDCGGGGGSIEVFVVANEAARLALDASVGAIVVQEDVELTYVLKAEPASEPDNWVEIVAAGKVTSVNTKTGDVVITIADIEGLQDILNEKANLSGATFTGAVNLTFGGTSITVNEDDNSTNIATTAFVKKVVEAMKCCVESVNGHDGVVVLSGADIELTGYSIASEAEPIVETDTINEAFGKIEKCLQVVDGGSF